MELDSLNQLTQRITDMEGRVSEIDKNASINTAVTTALIQRNLEVQEKYSASLDKLSDALTDMKITMSAIQKEIKDNAEKTTVLTQKLDEIRDVTIKVQSVEKDVLDLKSTYKTLETKHNKDIEVINAKFEKHDEIHKIDVVSTISKNIQYVLSIGGLIAIVLFVIEFIK